MSTPEQTAVGKTHRAREQQDKSVQRTSGRPPLGPNARKNLGIFGVLTLIHTLATVVFSAALATMIARGAHAGFAALATEHERRKASVSPEEYRSLIEFSGDAQARLDNLAPQLLGDSNALTAELIVAAVVALAVRAGADYLLAGAAARAAAGAKTTIRTRLLERVLATGGTDTPAGAGATAILISRGLDALDNYYTKTLTSLVGSVIVPLTLWVVLALLDIPSAVTVACTLPLVPVFMVLIGKTTREDTAAAQDRLHRLSDHILELVRGLPVLIGLGREKAQTRALKNLGEAYRERTMKTLQSAFMSSLALELITTISIAVVAVLIGVRLVNGQMGLDTAVLVLLLAPECYQPLRDAGAAYHQSEDGVAALRAAQEIIDTPLPCATPNTPEGEQLIVENLSVAYPGRGKVLDHLSFSLPAGRDTGEMVAIMGPSGCGKSTLLGVLAGMVRDGLVPTGATAPVRVSGTVGGVGNTLVVPQSPQFAAETVLGEMALYRLSGTDTEARQAAAYLAGEEKLSAAQEQELDAYLEQLGLDQLAHRAPASLSAGQARRLAIARVLARADAITAGTGQPLTVLVDEPTAHLDAHSARLVTIALARLISAGARVLVITHEGQLASHCTVWLRATAEGASYRWELVPNPNPRPIPGVIPDIETHHQPVIASIPQEAILGQEAPGAAKDTGCGGHNRQEAQRQKEEKPAGVVRTLATLRAITGIGPVAATPAVLMAAATSLAAAALSALSGWLIVRAAEGPAMMYLMVAIVGVRFFGLGRATARYAERLITHSRVLAAANTLRVRAWTGAYRNASSVRALLRGDALLEKLIGGIDELRDSIPRVILPPAAHLLVMAAALITTGAMMPQALVPVAAAAIVSTFVIPYLVLVADAAAEALSRSSTARLLRVSASILSAAWDVRANTAVATAVATARHADATNRRALDRGAYASGIGRAAAGVTWWGAALWCAAIAYPLAITGQVSAPESAIIVLMCTAMVESTISCIEAVRAYPAFARLVHRLAPDISLVEPESATEWAQKSGVDTGTDTDEAALELVEATARWPGMSRPVFTGLNAACSPGYWTGITGESGAGKSTALAAMLGLLPLESGQVRADGRQLTGPGLRGYAAWCPQAAHIFESTLEGNLALAQDKEHRPTRREMVQVLHRVGLGPWLSSLPEGLDTRVGAGGGFLSGGQRQRLAVARALLVDSPVLLLDEPTAHLDAESAAALMQDLEAATRRHATATMLVSHRPEDIARCDTVVTLE